MAFLSACAGLDQNDSDYQLRWGTEMLGFEAEMRWRLSENWAINMRSRLSWWKFYFTSVTRLHEHLKKGRRIYDELGKASCRMIKWLCVQGDLTQSRWPNGCKYFFYPIFCKLVIKWRNKLMCEMMWVKALGRFPCTRLKWHWPPGKLSTFYWVQHSSAEKYAQVYTENQI